MARIVISLTHTDEMGVILRNTDTREGDLKNPAPGKV